MKSLQSLLAVREGHISPQLQVLASMVGTHSRLGSITDKLAHALQTWQPLGEPPPPATWMTHHLISLALAGTEVIPPSFRPAR